MQIEEEPATYTEAAKNESWRRAMEDELNSIESNKTWRRVRLPERTLMPPRGGVNRRDDQIKPFFPKNLSFTGQGG
jgi:hypothetical protein